MTIRPPPRRLKAGTAARMPSSTPRTLTSIVRSKISIGIVTMSPLAGTPAFKIIASKPPNSLCARETAALFTSASVTSPSTIRTRFSLASSFNSTLGRSMITTDPPLASKASTVARPIPEAPPVTIETRVIVASQCESGRQQVCVRARPLNYPRPTVSLSARSVQRIGKVVRPRRIKG